MGRASAGASQIYAVVRSDPALREGRGRAQRGTERSGVSSKNIFRLDRLSFFYFAYFSFIIFQYNYA